MDGILMNVQKVFPSIPLTCLICILILFTCFFGDHLLFMAASTSQEANGPIIRALVDSSTHAAVGGLVWALVENYALLSEWKKWMNCFFCSLLAAVVDVDHFLAAGAFDLQRATNLSSRPPFHNTSIIPVVLFLCWAFRHYSTTVYIFGLMFLGSWLSHHLRDANRRGLWLAPFGHTPALPSYLFISLTITLAIFIRIVYHFTVSNSAKLNDGLSIVTLV